MAVENLDRLADVCQHCGGEMQAQVKTSEKVHPYRVICLSCGVGSAWHGSVTKAWQSVTKRNHSPKVWRCFHCDQVFITEHEARLHFGATEDQQPACLIAAERGLLAQYRRLEEELAQLRWKMLEEDTEAARAHYGHMARHSAALVKAEEIGYEKGLADGRALAAGATPP